jgi:non-specific serine/threonine protein kinase
MKTVPTGVFALTGDYWTLGYRGARFTLRDTFGLGIIQRLLQHPGERFSALDFRSGQLRKQLDYLLKSGDNKGAEEVKAELERIEHEVVPLVSDVGLNWRPASAAELARLNVTRAIRWALERISNQQSELGQLLIDSIRTGSYCCYLPNPEVPIHWRFELDRPEAT